ncbi:hypothetical protein [Pantoea stewartii]|uniref:hypothetical protein n=1 Tax=Pantoea stewartii TaxID=66269 RepID=UPI0016274056|nr:hypothetical protein [Pantoea stewartii]MBC0852625.1 hypothetical protein [Pantoea stewartii]
MDNKYPDKGQVKVGSISAFGIDLDSRHNLAWELAELLNFADEAARNGLAKYVLSAQYDSVSNTCSFELAPGITHFSDIGMKIKDAVGETVSQYEWPQGMICHGTGTRTRQYS